MKRTLIIAVLVSCASLMLVGEGRSQSLLFETLAGGTSSGSVEGTVNEARFNRPTAVAVDFAGTVYVADTLNGTIRMITTNGFVSTFAGAAGVFGDSNGTGTNALFYGPQGIAVDATRALYVADTANATIRKIATNGAVTTLAGSAGNANSFDGIGMDANFYQPEGIAVDNGGNVYVADAWNHTIRKITSAGQVSTLAGLAGNSGSIDGTNSKARFNRPAGIAVDGADNLFVSDSLNHTVRQITSDGTVTTIAGLPGVWGNTDSTNSAARFFQPQGIVVDSAGNLFVADSGNQTIRKISLSGTNWSVSTVGGASGSAGDADGTGDLARFFFPAGVAVNTAGYLLVADAGNNRIRNETFELRSLDVMADGRLAFAFNGKNNLNYAIDRSTDLVTWSVVTNVSRPDGMLEFVESSASSEKRFYRARVAP